jgi:hypothetical protein
MRTIVKISTAIIASAIAITTTSIILVSTKIIYLKNAIAVCHKRLISAFSKQNHIIESIRPMHEYFFSYVRF